ncbi:hypothetical protein LTR37_011206 [Vermiconidia calcicola]|uniref:Uncharacterized protein n=1 Tax=Vermiconidia calcicola TaxID=1690605 RepID=A0ACC3N3U3_9PEZI|nr:hypothetical protein LTR37_011206 [Vermiconidia calcicola]
MSQKRSRADAFDQQHAPFVAYGTPLPPNDPDSRDDGSYVPVWKQEVTDERGRKRLHGAFTGGWSAGYYNSVGSKEGWTPKTFVSSRGAKKEKDGEAKGQRVEDFMDEEDLAARDEAQQLETVGAFAGLGSTSNTTGEVGKGMFFDLFRTSNDETMGVKLLQRMGWRQGQGVGPKVRRRAKGERTGEMHLFAPENSRMVGFERKRDRKGLGFAGEVKLAQADGRDEEDEGSDQDARILQTNRSSKLLTKPKQKVEKSGAFGVGVLNDTGSDEDEDSYSMGPQISYNRIIGGDKKKKKGLISTNASSTAVQKPTFTSKKLAQRTSTLSSGFRKCHDGRLPLEGFILTLAPLAILHQNKYPPPTVPEGWKPAKLAQDSTKGSTNFQSAADAAKASTLDPKARAAMLGEQQLPGKSVFDFLSSTARNRLASASGKPNLPPALGEKAPAGYQPDASEQRRTLWDLVPPISAETAAAALQRVNSGSAPYTNDPSKLTRYHYFLSLHANYLSNPALPERPKGASTEDWVKEMREFAQAAEVFRPISGLMATRFTTSSSSAPRLASDAATKQEKEPDPAVQAAKLGMYGPGTTRSRQPFYPTRLLCKRFNVKPPANVDPGASGADEAGTRRQDVVSQSSLERMMREASFKSGGGFVSGGVEGGQDAPAERQKVVDVERNDALEGQKAGEAVFKAIFGSDDEDED